MPFKLVTRAENKGNITAALAGGLGVPKSIVVKFATEKPLNNKEIQQVEKVLTAKGFRGGRAEESPDYWWDGAEPDTP